MIVIKLTDHADISASSRNNAGTIIHSSHCNQLGRSGVAAEIMLAPKKYRVTTVSDMPMPAGIQKKRRKRGLLAKAKP